MLWKPTGGMELLTLPAGFYIFRFALAEDRDRILEGGPWFIQNRLLLLKPWDHRTKLQKINLSTIPTWVKIHDLPMDLWTPALISHLASGIGVPLYMDQATAARSRISYARICVEISADQQLPRQISFTINDDQECTLRLEYDRRPPRCSHCCVFGHGDANCPIQPPKEKAVWKPKQPTQPTTIAVPTPTETPTETQRSSGNAAPVIGTGKNPVAHQVLPSHREGSPTADSSRKQSPRHKGKQPVSQGNSTQTITVNNRFQYLLHDIEDQEQDKTEDQVEHGTMAGGYGQFPADPTRHSTASPAEIFQASKQPTSPSTWQLSPTPSS